VFVPDKSTVKVLLVILDIFFLGKLNIVYMDRGACFFMCCECDMDRLGSISLTSFGLQVGWFAVSVNQSIDHCPWLLMHYRQQRLLW
jgi:hypothetical protein